MQPIHRNTASSLPPGQVHGLDSLLFMVAFGWPDFSSFCVESVSKREYQVG